MPEGILKETTRNLLHTKADEAPKLERQRSNQKRSFLNRFKSTEEERRFKLKNKQYRKNLKSQSKYEREVISAKSHVIDKIGKYTVGVVGAMQAGNAANNTASSYLNGDFNGKNRDVNSTNQNNNNKGGNVPNPGNIPV